MLTTEERRTRRISYQAPIGGVLLGEQRLLNMVSTNLSVGGMFAHVDEAPAVGAKLVCNVATAGGRSAIQVHGRVARLDADGGVGIEFVDLCDDEVEELYSIVGVGLKIPPGEQSAAVYELMELETAITAKTVVDEALQEALDAQIDEGMEDVSPPSPKESMELPESPPAFASVDEPAFTQGLDAPRTELVIEETDKIHVRSREPRSWLIAAAVGTVGAVALGMAGLGLFHSEDASDDALVAEEARDDKRQRVRALVEGEDDIALRREGAVERIRAAALRDSELDHEEPGSKPEKPAVVRDVRSQVRRQVLSGVIIRESAESFLVRLPITGSAEGASDYVMNDPGALAVNLPYALPKKGFAQSLEPKSEVVRRVWVRERLGGMHLRVFFQGDRPDCNVQTSDAEVVVRCKR